MGREAWEDGRGRWQPRRVGGSWGFQKKSRCTSNQDVGRMVIRRRGQSPGTLALLRDRPWPKEAKGRLLGTGAFLRVKDQMEGRRGEAVDDGLTL